MNPKRPDQLRKHLVLLHAVEDVQTAVHDVVVFPKIYVDGAEDDPASDAAVEGRDIEPVPQVEAGDVRGDELPYFWGNAAMCRLRREGCLVTDINIFRGIAREDKRHEHGGHV